MELILQLLHVSWLDPAIDAIIYFLESHSTGVPEIREGEGGMRSEDTI